MTREIKILFNFTCYILLGVLICLLGVSNVFASSYDSNQFSAQLYDNINGSLSSVTTYQESGASNYHYGYIGLTANSSGGAWGVSSPIPLIANHTYSMTVDPFVPGCGFTILSTYNRIGVGTSISNAKTSYQNNTNVNEKFSKAISNSQFLQFVFTPTINSSYIVFAYSTTSSCSSTTNQLSNIIIDDLGESGVSQDQINTSLTNQTNELNNSIQNSTNTITGEINDMENSIVDSNKETQEVIKDQFNTCRPSNNIWDEQTELGDISFSNGSLIPATNRLRSKNFIPVDSNTTYFIKSPISINVFQYTSDKSFVGRSLLGNSSFTTSSTTKYLMIELTPEYGTTYENNIAIFKGSANLPYEPYGEVCNNKIDETNDKLDSTNNQLGDLNNNITNDNIDDDNVSNAFDQFEDFVDENATISSLLTLPVTLFSAILNGMQNSCVPFNLGSLYGEDLILPCINISSYLGSTLWTMIDIIISGFAIYFISQKFIKVFNNFSSMKEGDVIDD